MASEPAVHAEDLRPCVSCGVPVADGDVYPWPGHHRSCAIVNAWRGHYREKYMAIEAECTKPPEVGPVNRYSADGIFVGDPASHHFVEALLRNGVWTFFLPRPESPQDARWFGKALLAAADEAERNV